MHRQTAHEHTQPHGPSPHSPAPTAPGRDDDAAVSMSEADVQRALGERDFWRW